MCGTSAPSLHSIILYHSGTIHSLACDYTLANDYEGLPPWVTDPWGLSHSYGSRGVRTKVTIQIDHLFLQSLYAFRLVCKVAQTIWEYAGLIDMHLWILYTDWPAFRWAHHHSRGDDGAHREHLRRGDHLADIPHQLRQNVRTVQQRGRMVALLLHPGGGRRLHHRLLGTLQLDSWHHWGLHETFLLIILIRHGSVQEVCI